VATLHRIHIIIRFRIKTHKKPHRRLKMRLHTPDRVCVLRSTHDDGRCVRENQYNTPKKQTIPSLKETSSTYAKTNTPFKRIKQTQRTKLQRIENSTSNLDRHTIYPLQVSDTKDAIKNKKEITRTLNKKNIDNSRNKTLETVQRQP